MAFGIAPLALIDCCTEECITGPAYLFCYAPLALQPVAPGIANLGAVIRGHRVASFELDRLLQRQFRLLGTKGVTAMAIAGIDMAAWDALSRAAGMPLAQLLGGELQQLPIYSSCGLGTIDATRAAGDPSGMFN